MFPPLLSGEGRGEDFLIDCGLYRRANSFIMNHGAIISDAESLQILKNDLRKRALKQRAAELKEASSAKREEILAEIERDVRKDACQLAKRFNPSILLH
jgi:hypothetical protein